MTTATVTTLNITQVSYLRAAIACLLAVQGEANRDPKDRRHPERSGGPGRDRTTTVASLFCMDLREEVLDIATAYGTVSPLDHQDGAELADLLGTGILELRVPEQQASTLGIQPYYDDAPGGYAGQVPAEDEAWKVPVLLTVVGAETAAEAGAAAREFLARATTDDYVNPDETVTVQAYDVGGQATTPPDEMLRAVELENGTAC